MPDDFPIESRFVIEARVGRGASGEVFKSTDRETGLPVAVKRLLAITTTRRASIASGARRGSGCTRSTRRAWFIAT